MYRATTPLQVFTFKEDPEQFREILITYSQGKNIILEKEKNDLTFDSSEQASGKYIATFRLTQEEANLFHTVGSKQISVQVRVLTENGFALASKVKSLYVEDVLDDKVLS